MKQSRTIRRTRLVAVALAIAAAGVFASVGMAGFGPELVGLSHKSTTPTTDQYPTSKVTICHHTHSQKNPFVTITVSQNAVAAHVRNHGDTIGPCSEQPSAAVVAPATAKVHKAHKAKLHLKGNSKGKHEGQGKNDGAEGAGHKPTSGPSTAEHGKGQGKGHAKTHGPPADRGQGNGNGHGQDKNQTQHGQGQGHGNGDTHGNGNGGNGKGH
jgi:hypothetical protein